MIPEIRESDPELLERYGRVAAGGQPEQFEYYVEALKMWFFISVYSPKPEHFVAVFDVITERKQHELAMQRSNRALRTISAGNEALIHATEESLLLQEMCNVAVNVGGYGMAWIGYARDDAEKTIEKMAQACLGKECPILTPFTWDKTQHEFCLAGQAIISGKPRVLEDILSDPEFNPWRESARQYGFASCIALPLMDGDKAFGALVLFDDKRNVFDADEVKVLEEMSGDLCFRHSDTTRQGGPSRARTAPAEKHAANRGSHRQHRRNARSLYLRPSGAGRGYREGDRAPDGIAGRADACDPSGGTGA